MSIPPYPIIHYPAVVLTAPTQPVVHFDKPLERIVKRLVPTMRQADGVGLAAPQVGLSRSLAVIEYVPRADRTARSTKPIPLHAIINPTILNYGGELDELAEGCLSCPDIELLVRRSTTIVVEFFSIDGKKTTKTVRGFAARIYQHEIDHLNGTLILDKAHGQRALIKAYRADPTRFKATE